MKTYLRFLKKPSFFSLNFPAAHDVMFHSISTTPSPPAHGIAFLQDSDLRKRFMQFLGL